MVVLREVFPTFKTMGVGRGFKTQSGPALKREGGPETESARIAQKNVGSTRASLYPTYRQHPTKRSMPRMYIVACRNSSIAATHF